MSSENFEKSLSSSLRYEGGYSNDPRDPGGATMRGVTQATYNAWRKSRGQGPANVKHITDSELKAIYRQQYWDASRCDELPSGLDFAVFDFAVNSGPRRAVMDLQRVLGVKVDGFIGVNTLAAIAATPTERLIDRYLDRRLAFLKSLKTWGTFGKGWSSRVASVRKLAKQLADDEPVIAGEVVLPRPGPSDAPKADPKDVALSKTPEGRGGALAAVGTAGTVLTEAADRVAPISDYSWVLQTLFALLIVGGVSLSLYAGLKRYRASET